MRGVAVTRVAVRTLFMCAPPPQPARPHLATAGLLVWVVAFLLATGMFIFTKGFSVPPTRNHDHPQLGCITPTDGRMKGVS